MVHGPHDYIPLQPGWLRDQTIFLCRAGSHAYGTNTVTSDFDLRGIAVPPPVYWTGFSKVFDQSVSSTPTDLVIYGLRKFMHLAAECNPSIIEVLWVDESDVLLCTAAGVLLRENRHLFLSQKAKHTFSGYAISQIKRIKTHRKWLLDPPKAPPERKDFDLPERRILSADQQGAAMARIQQLVDSWELDLSSVDDAVKIHIMAQLARVIEDRTTTDAFHQAGRLLGFEDNMLDYLEREKRYQAAARHWEQYNTWKKERNPVRAALEAKMGFDGKHASHAVRLTRICREILEGKGVIVKRPDAEELLGIRNGAWTYEQILEFVEREDAALYEVMRASSLPKSPDLNRLDYLCSHIVETSRLEVPLISMA